MHLILFSIKVCNYFSLLINDIEKTPNDSAFYKDDHDKLNIIHVHDTKKDQPSHWDHAGSDEEDDGVKKGFVFICWMFVQFADYKWSSDDRDNEG